MNYLTRHLVAKQPIRIAGRDLATGDTFEATEVDAGYYVRHGKASYKNGEPAPERRAAAPQPAWAGNGVVLNGAEVANQTLATAPASLTLGTQDLTLAATGGAVTASTAGGDTTSTAPDLEAMDRDQLVALAAARGVEHHPLLGEKKLRELLSA